MSFPSAKRLAQHHFCEQKWCWENKADRRVTTPEVCSSSNSVAVVTRLAKRDCALEKQIEK